MIQNKGILIIIACLFVCSCSIERNNIDNNKRLWYTYPARYWNSQALHLGNGYFGASFFGGIEEEVLSISEASMWTGEPANNDWEKAGINPKAYKSLPFIREAIVNGEIHKADSLVTSDFFGSSESFGHFTSVGKLKIEFLNHSGKSSGYLRSLDLENSLGLVEYKSGNIRYKREYFCSYPDRILAMKFSADKPAVTSFRLGMEIIQDSTHTEIEDHTYIVRGFIDGNHRPFQVHIVVKNSGGTVGREGKFLTVSGADSVVVFLTVATNYRMKYPDYTGENPDTITRRIIRNLDSFSFTQLKTRHVNDYRSLSDRVSFSLEGNKNAEKLPTNERFKKLRSGESDPGYKVLAFNLGRYMIISSSRPETLPANLQGVWNVFKSAPWAGNYQSNINLQEIYWSCGPTDLAECQQAYIDWIEDVAKSGHEAAKRIYGTDGWISHTTGNIWGHAAPIGGHPWGMFPMGAAWHCQHVWDQFAFTQDTAYLKEHAYPLLRDASIFWLCNLVPFKGYYITAPTVSAEHGALLTKEGLNPAFHDFESDKYCYSIAGVYQDIEMLWDLFTNTSDAARMLGYSQFADSLLRTREKLLPLKTGKYGQLQEWYEDIDNPECHHRHIAHLFAVCPGKEIHPVITPELARAAKKSLDMRGDGRFPEQELVSGGNWARAHRMWCWTRLLDGNRANKIMTEMLTEQGFENGLTFQHANFSSGGPDFYTEGELNCHFQLDGSASVPGCIAEMLVQSHLGMIHLMPALPDEFKTGKITGIKGRGGYKINMEWKNGKLVNAQIFYKKNLPKPKVFFENKIIRQGEMKNIEIVEITE